MGESYFCEYQFLTKDNKSGLGGCCNLLFAEGIAYSCPYSVEDISLEKKGRKNVFRIENDKDGECKGFRIGINARINLMSKCYTKYL